MIDDDEDDYEGYFLRPANEYNIKEKIIQANQESFAIPTPPSPRQHASGERRVTFREQLVDYEPDEYSSEDDGGYGGGGGGGVGGAAGPGGGSSGHKKNAVIETVADVHRDGEIDGSGADTIIEELHLDDRRTTPEPQEQEEEEEVVVEEEQLEGDYDEEGERPEDRMEKHKTGVEHESVVSEEEEEEEEDEVEEETVHEEHVEEEDEEEEPTDGSSMDTEIHNPESSEDISSSPLKTYRSEADSRSGSGDSQAEEGHPGEDDGDEAHYADDHDGDGEPLSNGVDHDSSSDGERPLEAHRTKRSTTCRRKCCRHKKSAGENLPYYNGFRSEYGLSREELEEKKRRLEARRQRVRERQQRRTAEQRQKAQSNEEAFSAWLHGKLRSSINKHQNMYDVKQSGGSAAGRLQQQQQPQNPKYRRRNGIHTMQQISYG